MQLVKKLISHSLCCTALVGVVITFSANAADSAEQGAAAQVQPVVNLSEAQVAQFADAYVAVQTLNEKYGPQIQQVTKPEQKQALPDLAQSQMKAAITRSGLTLDEYKQIAAAANDSDVLRERIATAVGELVEPAASDS